MHRSQEKTASTKGAIERSARRDPHATPPIGPKDVAAGLFSLVNRGLVAAHVDLTPVRPAVTLDGTCELCMRANGGGGDSAYIPRRQALARHPAPVLQAPSRMHPHKDQFGHHSSCAYISPFGFNVSNTKLDLLSGLQPDPTSARNLSHTRANVRLSLSPDVGTTLADTKTAQVATAALTALKTLPPAPTESLGIQLPDADVAVSVATQPRADQSAGRPVRGFEELMDTFSLHHYIVRNGTTLDSTPEFVSFQRKFASDWGAVQQSVRGPSPACSQLLFPPCRFWPLCARTAKYEPTRFDSDMHGALP